MLSGLLAWVERQLSGILAECKRSAARESALWHADLLPLLAERRKEGRTVASAQECQEGHRQQDL
jgi:hypothetical protein